MYLSLIGLFCTKEEFSLLAAALSFPLYFYYRRKKLAVGLFIFSILFFFFLTSIFMPAVSEKGVYQHAHLSTEAKTPLEFTEKIASDPLFALKSLASPPEKIKTLVISLASFAFLPLLVPFSFLIPSIEQFLMRFLYTGPQFTVWRNVNHHAAPIALLFPVAAIYGIVRLLKTFPHQKKTIIAISSVLLIVATIAQDIVLKAPIHSLFKASLYQTSDFIKDARAIVERVPLDASVAAQNSFFPHLSERKEIYLLPEVANARFIAVDFHPGPNKFSPGSLDSLKDLVNHLLEEGSYRIIYQKGQAALLEKSTN